MPLVVPEARGGRTLIVTCLVEALLKEFVRKHSIFGKAVDAASSFKLYPAVTGIGKEVVFLGEFVRDVV